MKRLYIILCFIFLCYIGCKKHINEPSDVKEIKIDEVVAILLVYHTSFESPEDTVGWVGLNESMFVSNPSPAVANKSLLIGGGCLQPVAFLKFDDSLSGHSYRLNCWGKIGEQGGSLVLTTAEYDSLPRTEVQINIKDSVWTHYTSEEFFCPKDKTLQLEIYTGGIIFVSIFIDYLGIEQLD
jgi:hypothetical protein